MDSTVVILAVLGFVGAAVQTVAGFGATFFLLPVLLIYFQPSTAITVSLLVANMVCLLVLAERRAIEFSWSFILRIVLAALPGIVLGAFVTTVIAREISQITVGVLIIIAALFQQYTFAGLAGDRSLYFSIWGAASSFTSGFLNAIASMAASPLVLWLRSYAITKNQLRDTLAVIFLIMNTTSLIVINSFIPITVTYEGVILFAWIAPLIILGNLLGRKLLPKIEPRHYRNILFYAVLFAGGSSVTLGVIGWVK